MFVVAKSPQNFVNTQQTPKPIKKVKIAINVILFWFLKKIGTDLFYQTNNKQNRLLARAPHNSSLIITALTETRKNHNPLPI